MTNPFSYAATESSNTSDLFAADIGQVTRVPDGNTHSVVIRLLAAERDTTQMAAPVTVDVRNDVSLPSVDDIVVLLYTKGGKPIVVGTLYARQDAVPENSATIRRLGHPTGDGHVDIHEDGQTTIHGQYTRPPVRDTDPDGPEDGAMWYRSDLDEYRGVENNTVVSFDTTDV